MFRLKVDTGVLLAVCVTLSLIVAPVAHSEEASPADEAAAKDDAFMDRLLDRLMAAESGGRRFAKNPRSSALGPFQFINGTFLDVVRRNFASEVAKMKTAEILHLRTDPEFAWRAARAFAEENARFLDEHGIDTTMVNLHLAHFAGPTGAVRVLNAEPDTLVTTLLSATAVRANPFLTGLTVEGLLDHLSKGYDGKARWKRRKAADGCPQKPKLVVRCHRGRPSCRRWIMLHQRILNRRWARRLAANPDLCKPATAETDGKKAVKAKHGES